MDKVVTIRSMFSNGLRAKELTYFMLFVYYIDLFNGFDMMFTPKGCRQPFFPINFFTRNLRDVPIIEVDERIIGLVLNLFFVDNLWDRSY